MQRVVVKSGSAPGKRSFASVLGLLSIAEVVECRRVRVGTPLVAADGGTARAKPAPVKTGRRCRGGKQRTKVFRARIEAGGVHAAPG